MKTVLLFAIALAGSISQAGELPEMFEQAARDYLDARIELNTFVEQGAECKEQNPENWKESPCMTKAQEHYARSALLREKVKQFAPLTFLKHKSDDFSSMTYDEVKAALVSNRARLMSLEKLPNVELAGYRQEQTNLLKRWEELTNPTPSKVDKNIRRADSLAELEDREIKHPARLLLNLSGWNQETQTAFDANDRSGCRVSLKPIKDMDEMRIWNASEAKSTWQIESQTILSEIKPAAPPPKGTPRNKREEFTQARVQEICGMVNEQFRPDCRRKLLGHGVYKAPDELTLKSGDKRLTIYSTDVSPGGMLKCLEHYAFDTHVDDSNAPGQPRSPNNPGVLMVRQQAGASR